MSAPASAAIVYVKVLHVACCAFSATDEDGNDEDDAKTSTTEAGASSLPLAQCCFKPRAESCIHMDINEGLPVAARGRKRNE